jgi:opacity protein-like surface antigen
MMTSICRQGTRCALLLAVASALLVPATADAQITRVSRSDPNHTINFNLGYFLVRAEESRVDGDVLVIDLESLAFDIDDFNGFTFGGEWLYRIGDYIESGAGLGYYQGSTTSVYRDVVHDSGMEIAQDLKLRMVPFSATVRFLPLGRDAPVEPYVGGGISIINWKYSEVGEFVDFSDDSIFRQHYVADGWSVGPVLLAGLRAPVADIWTIGGEVRWQRAEGDTDALESGLLGDKIDLGGWSANFTFGIKF